MQFISLLFTLFLIAGLVQALPVSKRSGGSLWGITYTAKNSDGSCHSAQQVSEYIQLFKKNGIKNIRTYSQECNQLKNIANAINAAGGGMKVVTSVWIDGTSKDEQEISKLASTIATIDKSVILGIAVGNENILSNRMTAGQLIQKMKQVKSKIKDVPVGTVETPGSFPDEVISASDIIFVNIHPFFAGVSASKAVSNLESQYNSFKSRCGNKQVIVGEVGWPTSGESNGKATPNVNSLATVISNIVNTNIKYFFFESHDSHWKDGGAFGVEPHWGIFDKNGNPKVPL